MNIVFLIATLLVLVYSRYINKRYMRCCHERKGFSEDLRAVNRILYVAPTVYSCGALLGANVLFMMANGSTAPCSLYMFFLTTPVCIWTVASLLKAMRMRPIIFDQPAPPPDTESVHTPKRGRRYDGRARAAAAATARHEMALPADADVPAPAETEMHPMGLVNDDVADADDGASMGQGSDSGSFAPLNVLTPEETTAYRRAIGVLMLFLMVYFVYMMLARSFNSEMTMHVQGCDIKVMEIHALAGVVPIFLLMAILGAVHAWGLGQQGYAVRVCQRATLLSAMVNATALMWFSQAGLYSNTGGPVLLALAIIMALGQQVIWGTPYILGLAKGAAHRAVRAEPRDIDDGDDDGGGIDNYHSRRHSASGYDDDGSGVVAAANGTHGQLLDFSDMDPDPQLVAAPASSARTRRFVSDSPDADDDDDNDDDDDSGTGSSGSGSGGTRLPTTTAAFQAAASRHTPAVQGRADMRDAKWSVMMRNPPFLAFLRLYMQRQHNGELLDFVVRIDIDMAYAEEPVLSRISRIFDDFLAAGAPHRVNVSGAAVLSCKQRLAVMTESMEATGKAIYKIDDTPYEPAAEEIRLILAQSVLPAFFTSREYGDYFGDRFVPPAALSRYAEPEWMRTTDRPHTRFRVVRKEPSPVPTDVPK